MGPRGENKQEGQTGETQDSSYNEPCWVLGFKPNTSSVSTCPELDSRDCLGRKKRVIGGHGAGGNLDILRLGICGCLGRVQEREEEHGEWGEVSYQGF